MTSNSGWEIAKPTGGASRVAVFMDWENLFLSAKALDVFPSVAEIMHHAAGFGRVVDARAYGDFNGDWYRHYRMPFLEHGVRQIHLARASTYSQKNRADILLAIEAIECAIMMPFIDTLFVCSGDSDFSELLIALRSKGKSVVLAAYAHATSSYARRLPDTFIDLSPEATGSTPAAEAQAAAEGILREAVEAARSAGQSQIAAASLKPLITKCKPDFDEHALGYGTFKSFLEAHPAVAPVSWQPDINGVSQLYVELTPRCQQLVPA